jgi:two-component system chemotaxis sensor kinase CheA
MNAIDLLLYDLLPAVTGWESGDLIGFASLRTSFDAITKHQEFSQLAKKDQQTLNQLHDSLWDLLDETKEGDWRALWASLSCTKVPPASPEVPSTALPPLAAVASVGIPVAGEKLYPDDYFDHIIQDPKMLGQLCDEVKEHMDTAQFTLVDLEYDSTNPENVNKIFRAFHTIKSSAAFLGLKNLEESAHAIEDLMVLVRDGVVSIDKELINVIFFGIGLLKDLVSVIETADFHVKGMVESFKQIDIYRSIAVFKRIHADHSGKKIGQILEESGQLDSATVQHVLQTQRVTKQKFGEIAVEQNLISPDNLRNSLRKQVGASRKSSFVKVSNERLNALVDIVGELVVNQSMLRQFLQNPENAREAGDRTFNQLESITTNIKNLVLSMGMVPIAEIFNKLRVVVRNTAIETGKTVNVEFQGDETELDRNVIESIYDPLVHIVRNAVDHGIEDPALRRELGKPAVATIRVVAEHKANSIEVSVSDNGQGIDRERVLNKALQRGLVTEAQARDLTEQEVYALLMVPGFSTKETVTEVSGRGVGLDVVRQNVEQIHGKVEIRSVNGQGSEFVIRIPLTLAIIDGFVTVIDNTKYIFPFNLIEEIVVPEASALTTLEDGQLLLFDRGAYTPIIVAAEVFGHPARKRNQILVIIGYENSRYGIAVDSILGKQEIVIKTLSEALSSLETYSGGTIFGDGSIGFVVDVEKFVSAARAGLHRTTEAVTN